MKFRSLVLIPIVTGWLLPVAAIGAEPRLDARVESLLNRMTLEEKIGQMTQVDSAALTNKSPIETYALGSVLSGGGSDPRNNSPQAWLDLAEECQSWALKTRLKVPLLYGVDAVHGHNNVDGAVIFPHNIGLGATRNAALVEQAARITAQEMAGTGINWTFAPCVAVAQDSRWGRTYESFSDSPDLAGDLGAAAVRGFQGKGFADPASVLACAKHYVGDGGTRSGVDRGDNIADEATLRKIHLAPYPAAIKSGVGSVMVSFSSWNGTKMHSHRYLITDVLKKELGFNGFVVSDWAAIDQLPYGYKGNIEAAINAGLDMAMVPNRPGQPNSYVDFITNLTALVREERVPMSRIDDAARRILRVKFEMGAFDRKRVDPALTAAIGSPAHRAVARECVRQSLVLLKNDRATLPLAKSLQHVRVVGKAADDLGMQCGGWTISWQGETGKVTSGGTTILEGIRRALSTNAIVTFSPDGSVTNAADAVIVVVGEKPYAEMMGDRKDLQLSPQDMVLIKNAKSEGTPVVTILLSGRPLILGEALEASDAFVAAWLPGTEGQGVADLLFGDCKPTGKLPRAWLSESAATPDQIKSSNPDLFPFGFGLTYEPVPRRESGTGRTATAQN